MAEKNLTIMDIARMAGVSKTTVSRFLNGRYEYMSEATHDRIKSVIDLAGYQPNNNARSLKSQKSLLVGLVVADIESPFSSAAIKSIGDAMLGTGYSIIAANSDNDFQREKDHIQSLMGHQVDGLIVNTTRMQNPYLIGLANSGVPIVLLDRYVNDYRFDITYIENRAPIFRAVDHLMEEGYSRLALFAQPCEEVSPRKLRRDAFVEKLSLMGVSNPEQSVYTVDINNQKTVRAAVSRLFEACKGESAPPAIIASNGVTTMHVVKALRNLGLSMPGQVGLCGYDDWGWASDLGWASLIDVGITTLSASIHDLGEDTARALLRRMENPESEKRETAIPAVLELRGSTRLNAGAR